MDTLRESLISKIDSIVAELDGTEQQVQIEATVLGRRQTRSAATRKIVLETFDARQWETPTPSLAPRPSEDLQDTAGTAPRRGSEDPRQPLTPVIQSNIGLDSSQPEVRDDADHPRRKMVGGLRLGEGITPPRTPSPEGPRQLAADQRNFPKRRKTDNEGPAKLQPSTVDKLIEGIWEQVHKPNNLMLPDDITDVILSRSVPLSADFIDISRRCRLITGVSRTSRSLEVMMQAHWVDSYLARIDVLREQRPDLRPYEHKKMVMTEACSTFEWSEKDLRNRMAIWKGYKEIKDVAGYAALTFAGPGVYRFCKYRMGFDEDAISKFQTLRSRLEVAADTIQPHWRQTLSLVGVSTQLVYRGHPHAWVVGKRGKDPVPLAWTYRQWDRDFSFEHLDSSLVDTDAWGTYEPRRLVDGPRYTCTLCLKPQSQMAERNECECFSDLFGPNAQRVSPVQVYSTEDGRNNGLIACCTFERGEPIGEFVGIITKDLEDVDVMQCQGAAGVFYQIWQGEKGNFTRFINHSCQANCQFQSFTWLGIQRTVVVSKGVLAGRELTVDYSNRYWNRLEKKCLCGEARCRYRERPATS